MGYSFSIKNANAVGHLVDGNIITFLEQTFSYDDQFKPNIEFIDELLSEKQEDFYTSAIFWRIIQPEINDLRREWEYLRDEISRGWRQSIYDFKLGTDYFRDKNPPLKRFLQRLSDLLSRCRVKTFLLPGFTQSRVNELMIDKKFLMELVHIHPGDSALILQLKERLYENSVSVLDSFSKFQTAYDKIEQWPGVLIWNESDSLFVSVESERDVRHIYDVIRFEKDHMRYLRKLEQRKKKYAYLFHLSDLHLGNKVADTNKSRTIQILENKLHELDDIKYALPIVTGDLMDSPDYINKAAYEDFSHMIKLIGFKQPIYVLGNHDIDVSGVFKRLTEQKAIISSLSSNGRIQLIPELKLALIKFDSNTGGKLAQGEIGLEQLKEVGNEMDKIKDKYSYTFIALLHHHPKEIENPEWYARDWYEAFLGRVGFEKAMKLNDADLFLQWIEERGVKYILHGHKHIPNIHNHNHIKIIAAGSSTGNVKHKEAGKTFLTYNLIKYDIENRTPVSCSIIAEDIIGAGAKNILLHKI